MFINCSLFMSELLELFIIMKYFILILLLCTFCKNIKIIYYIIPLLRKVYSFTVKCK